MEKAKESRSKEIEVECHNCGKKCVKKRYQVIKGKTLFCGRECANIYQKCKKVGYTCKICNANFDVYPSEVKKSKSRGHNIQYCSLKCRDNDSNRIQMLIEMNNKQCNKKELNNLEKSGSSLLNECGIEFYEQYMINDKITVDVYIPKYNLIIEWWGDYWHGYESKLRNGQPDKRQEKRMRLDRSQKAYFLKCGFNFLNFWEHEVYENNGNVKDTIRDFIIGIENNITLNGQVL